MNGNKFNSAKEYQEMGFWKIQTPLVSVQVLDSMSLQKTSAVFWFYLWAKFKIWTVSPGIKNKANVEAI